MVVGGLGFIGAHVCALMAENGYEVISYDVKSFPFSSGEGKGSIRYVQGDLLDQERFVETVGRLGVAGIIDTVATGDEAAARKDPAWAIHLNVQSTLNALEAARRNQVRRFVYLSTAGVYGKRADAAPARETDAITWRKTIYHPSHYMGEILVEMYREVFGLDALILRPLSVYGPAASLSGGDAPEAKFVFFGPWLEKALRGEEVEVKGADTLSDVTYVKDAARAVDLAYSSEGTRHALFNISSGVLVSYRAVAEAIRKHAPAARFRFVAGVQENPLRPTQGPLDISRAKEELHFSPRYGLEAGIGESIDWLKKKKR
jgi:nucleoside-diphosphate-sugar epimerase